MQRQRVEGVMREVQQRLGELRGCSRVGECLDERGWLDWLAGWLDGWLDDWVAIAAVCRGLHHVGCIAEVEG